MQYSLQLSQKYFVALCIIVASGSHDAIADTLANVDSPVVVKLKSFEGEGDDREAVVEVTNKTAKPISRLGLRLIALGKDGQALDDFSHSIDRWFGLEHKKELGAAQTFTLKTRVQPESVSVVGFAKSLEWNDRKKWPACAESVPKKGESPVSSRVNAIITTGDFVAPIIEFFNHGSRVIERLEYRIEYRGIRNCCVLRI
ncbi:MAG: hypothetical protein AAGG48_23310 [Planctomycetota bacterium]